MEQGQDQNSDQSCEERFDDELEAHVDQEAEGSIDNSGDEGREEDSNSEVQEMDPPIRPRATHRRESTGNSESKRNRSGEPRTYKEVIAITELKIIAGQWQGVYRLVLESDEEARDKDMADLNVKYMALQVKNANLAQQVNDRNEDIKKLQASKKRQLQPSQTDQLIQQLFQSTYEYNGDFQLKKSKE
jgi:hypothetical protein